MLIEDWKPNAADFEYRPYDLLLLRYGRGAGKLLGPDGQLLDLCLHRQAVAFQTKGEAQRFIQEKARRFRGTLFFALRSELLHALTEEEPVDAKSSA